MQQKLLADSHRLVMDLRWQIHHSEKNWNREKVELLDRLDRERQEWGRQEKELLWRIEQVRVPLGGVGMPGLETRELRGETETARGSLPYQADLGASRGRGRNPRGSSVGDLGSALLRHRSFHAKSVGNFTQCVRLGVGITLLRC